MSRHATDCPGCGRRSDAKKHRYPCSPCSARINKAIERLIDSEHVEVGKGHQHAADLGISHDVFLQRLCRIRRRKKQQEART